MIKSGLNSPYKNGKPFYTAQIPGVYIIFKKNEIVYVGYSGYNVYKTLYRHFQSWNDPVQVRVTYNKTDPNIKVRVIYCNSRKAKNLESALIIKFEPKDNPQKLLNLLMNNKEKKVIEELENEFIMINGDLPF